MKKIISAVLLLSLIIPLAFSGVSAAGTVTSADFTKEELECNTYDIKKYTTPYWEGNIVYNEVVFPLKNENEELAPFSLMYDATEIISVKNYTLTVTYKEGVDYKLEDGKLVILEGGRIKVKPNSYIHPKTVPSYYEVGAYYPHKYDTGYEYWNENSELSLALICVTYIHNDTWHSAVPQSNVSALPKTVDKLINKEYVSVVLTGDSVSVGAMGSRYLGLSPYADSYPLMTINALKQRYDNPNIILQNSAVGGTISTWTPDALNKSVIAFSPDLVMIAFGMNDSSYNRVGISDEEFERNIRGRIEYIRRSCPDCEFLLIASVYGNPYTFPAERYESHAAILHKIASDTEGVGVCDPQEIEKGLFDDGRKQFVDFMGDNMVHPNDLGMRLITQTIVESLTIDVPQYKSHCVTLLTNLADLPNHLEDGRYALLADIIAVATDEINACQTEDDIHIKYNEYTKQIEAVLHQCAPGTHTFTAKTINPTCKEMGGTVNVCDICAYEETVSTTPSLNREHVWDSGRTVLSPGPYTTGVKKRTCAVCGDKVYEEIPKAGTPDGETVLHVQKGLNYMEEADKIYLNDDACVEMDVCPLDTSNTGAIAGYTPYIGLWCGGYSIAAAYNFRNQRFEIVRADLPYRTASIVYAKTPFEWKDGEWHKVCFNVRDNTISIYCDGELQLTSSNSLFNSKSAVPVVYSIGEFNLDNFRLSDHGYDPVSGTGNCEEWGFNEPVSKMGFNSKWRYGMYTTLQYREEVVNPPHTHYVSPEHEHVGNVIYTLPPTCNDGGWDECVCSICEEHFYINHTPALAASHTLSKTIVITPATKDSDGFGVCTCTECGSAFTTVLPYEETLLGDANGDGKINAVDASLIVQYIGGITASVNAEACDMNKDGKINSYDVVLVQKVLAGMTI